MKHARPPVKVQNERRMASFFVWMAWWCRAVLMHRTRWSFLESKRQRVKETKRQRDEETKRRRDGETGSQRDEEMKSRRGGCLNRVCSMVVQWSFNGWCCFSRKAWQIFATAWQIFATAWQKIRMPCAGLRQGGCLGGFIDVFLALLEFFKVAVGSEVEMCFNGLYSCLKV